jgi:hypothetical protein
VAVPLVKSQVSTRLSVWSVKDDMAYSLSKSFCTG